MGFKISLKKRLHSFKFAFEGIIVMFKEEANALIHLFLSIVAIAFGFILNISISEWCLLILCIGFVFAMELINTSIENLSNYVSPEKKDIIKKVKDLSAAGVLISALAAFVIGIIIFLPKLIM